MEPIEGYFGYRLELATLFCISTTTIDSIRSNKTWKHLK
jgi:hypothetical protein